MYTHLPHSLFLSERDEDALWLAALQESRIQADFTDVVTIQHPAEKTL
jgi:hypothetical protein